jgi:hypothetical protein
MRHKSFKVLRTTQSDTAQRVALIATCRLLIGVVTALIIYTLAAHFLGSLIADDQKVSAWVDDNWWHMLVTAVLATLAVVIGLKASYRAVKQAGWPRPKYAISTATLLAISFLVFVQTFIPVLGTAWIFLSFLLYGAALFGIRSQSYHERWRAIRVVALIFLAIALAFTLISYSKPAQHPFRFVDAMWLPNPQQATDQDILSLPTTASTELSLYGQLLLIHSSDIDTYPYPFPIGIYEGRANAWFRPASCPNLASIEEIIPSECKQIGTVHGAKVYAISRSLPLGDYEVYTQFGSTAIYFNLSMGDEKYALQYLQTFRKVASNQVAKELESNSSHVQSLASTLKQKRDTLAQRLPFNVLLPNSLPQGWFLNGDTRVGPELDKPTIQELGYSDGHDHSVSVIVVPLTGFNWQGSCGPIPYEHTPLNCYPVPNQNYYYANKPDFQYTFRTIGNAVAITVVNLEDEDFKTTGAVDKVLKTANDIGSALRPVEVSKLPKTDYIEGLGQN